MSFNSIDLDKIIDVLNSFCRESSEKKLQNINNQIDYIKEKIDHINLSRERFSNELNAVSSVIEIISSKSDDIDCDTKNFILFVLEDYAKEIKDKIFSMKPDELLLEKHRLKEEKERILRRANVANTLIKKIKN